jgi:hypothetical protein
MFEEDQKREPAKRRNRSLRAEFDSICDKMGSISDKEAILDFLHTTASSFTGQVFSATASWSTG